MPWSGADYLEHYVDQHGFTVGVSGGLSEDSRALRRSVAARRRERHRIWERAALTAALAPDGLSAYESEIAARRIGRDGFLVRGSGRVGGGHQKSAGVKLRQRRALLRWADALDGCTYLVLTVGDQWSDDPAVWSSWMRRLYVRLDSRLAGCHGGRGVPWYGVWSLAAQARNAPHWDALLKVPGLDTAEIEAMVSEEWIGITGTGGSPMWARRERAVVGQPVAELGGVLAYVLREVGKVAQGRFPEGVEPVQWWGAWHRARLKEQEIEPERVELHVDRLAVLAEALGLGVRLVDVGGEEPVWALPATWFGAGAHYLATGDIGPLQELLRRRDAEGLDLGQLRVVG